MLNKELLIAASSQAVDPGYVLEHSYFEVTKVTSTRASDKNSFYLSFYTPFGLVLDKYWFSPAMGNYVLVPTTEFNNLNFDLSNMVGYKYSKWNENWAEDYIIKIKEINSGIVPYEDVHIVFYPNEYGIDAGTYTFYPY